MLQQLPGKWGTNGDRLQVTEWVMKTFFSCFVLELCEAL